MDKKQVKAAIRYTLYALVLFVFYIVQTTPGLFAIRGIQPALVVPVALSVAVLETELAGAAFGAVAGLMWDLSALRISGFNGIILCVLCVICAFLFMFSIRKTVVNFTLICAGALATQCLLDYLFNFMPFYDGSWTVLLFSLLPVALYTLVCTPFIFLLMRKINRKFAFEE